MTTKTIHVRGMIRLDGAFAELIGFTSDLFDGYMWLEGGEVTVSLIFSLDPGKGHLRGLFGRIRAGGMGIFVPTPSARMSSICERYGFQPATRESDLGTVYGWQIGAA